MSHLNYNTSTKLARLISHVGAIAMALQNLLVWISKVFVLEDPFVPTPEPIMKAPTLGMEWMIGIWIYECFILLVGLGIVYTVWFAFQRLLDIYEMQVRGHRKATD